MNEQIPYVNSNREHEFLADAEAALFVLGIFYVIRRAFRHHHTRALAVMVLSGVSAFIVMTQLDMASDWAWLFWALVVVVFLSLAKILSLDYRLLISCIIDHALFGWWPANPS